MEATRHDLTAPRGWHRLVPFPAAGGDPAFHIAAHARLTGHDLEVEFQIDGAIAELVLPQPEARPERRDGLWRSTCFEVFSGAPGESSYTEFNLAPNGDWAAWTFASYRESPAQADHVAPSHFNVERTATSYRLAATLVLRPATVLETVGGTIAHMALAHPRGQPDFHAPEARVLRLVADAARLAEDSEPDSSRPPCNPGPRSGRSRP